MKAIFIILGFLFTIIGVIGIILPILPTTPFLLIASFCFMKGSDKLNNWFKSTKLYKNNLESFNKNRSMTFKTKAVILGFATIMLLIPFITVPVLPMRIFIIVLIILKYYFFIFKIKTVKPEKKRKTVLVEE
ncbi:YbaN family protein [Xylanivirga thermophila]|uniref:YbaN family protein n=1 Tax=Xylanivirga thermophila TaxID=2496273 RepID=UPI00101C57DA|nr:YbaN family protein [Xylanivirga thermophila]